MNKWRTHGRIIPIGLSLLLSGCIFIPWESLDDEWQLVRQEYANNSGSDVTLVFTYFKVQDEKETPEGILDVHIKDTVLHDTLMLVSKGFSVHREFISEISEDVVTICKDMYYLDLYDSSRAVRLLVENNVVQEWIGPPWIDTDSINSPFNYRSWFFEESDSVPLYKAAAGKITFTITDEDLK